MQELVPLSELSEYLYSFIPPLLQSIVISSFARFQNQEELWLPAYKCDRTAVAAYKTIPGVHGYLIYCSSSCAIKERFKLERKYYHLEEIKKIFFIWLLPWFYLHIFVIVPEIASDDHPLEPLICKFVYFHIQIDRRCYRVELAPLPPVFDRKSVLRAIATNGEEMIISCLYPKPNLMFMEETVSFESIYQPFMNYNQYQ